MSAFDVLVIGAGHNGLAAAALLGHAGRRVCVVERRDLIGGLAASEEFHPGYRTAGVLQDTTRVRLGLLAPLALARHGLRERALPPSVLALGADGNGLALDGDPRAAAAAIAAESEADARRYPEFVAALEKIRPVVRSILERPPIDVVRMGENSPVELLRRWVELRRLGRRESMALLRLPPMSVADWLDEWFESDLLKAALALPAIRGCWMGPRSPGSNANLILDRAAAGPGIEGGAPALLSALSGACARSGVEIRTGSPVCRILTRGRRAVGCVLADGTEIVAKVVAASCDPKHALLGLLEPGALPARVEDQLRAFRTRGTTAVVRLALDRALEFSCKPGQPVEFARTGACLDDLERAFDAVKYRSFSERPILEIHQPSLGDPDLAPAGHAVASILVHFAAYEREPPWDAAGRDRLGDTVISTLEAHATVVKSRVVARDVLTPRDLEERFGLTGGQIHHGEQALDQWLVRPVPTCATYRTPIEGLFLCGAGSHPGGGLTCAPGALAASAILSRR